ncbi:hypothetical protein MMAGJ_74370 [Mycolicibacterium mageritense]|uniref:Class I SAM-dependent methyltransferase n=1 Tax=Mycolicibacterium mageritense TaxID=53462 RepID=A0ABM7I5F2_MYCME|nr:class I SAM-dependent methyltransferase [Mycolicibacterium mageritense]MCC9185297.1 hypothetical protein [Mycolicibacterium mageritense]BBX38155.1 hypothetical protein MMAGJ_74370 [Mycolicibacterium mageritense]CDO27110.1 16S rRNA (adenine(1408)-N(1))-methyltransferase [Mycolicibacterium mageritense DSM 44476 = CIP 104973]
MLAAAAADSKCLVVGVDANAAGMIEASRRAARPGARGLPNAVFVAAAVERLPVELTAVADDVTVNFPWGSLLRGLLAPEPTVLGAVAGTMKPGAQLRVVFSVTDHDGIAGVPTVDDAAGVGHLAMPYAAAGLQIDAVRPAGEADVEASSWGKRLRAGSQRSTWLLRAQRTKDPQPASICSRRMSACPQWCASSRST